MSEPLKFTCSECGEEIDEDCDICEDCANEIEFEEDYEEDEE